MKTLSANHIEFPQYHQVLEIASLGNFHDQSKVYKGGKERKQQRFRLESLMRDLDTHAMQPPIIVNKWVEDMPVSVGHQRLWYALHKGYTHIDCYVVPDQNVWNNIFNFTNSEDYWEKYMNEYGERKELIAKEITHPQYHRLIPLDELRFKWDNVTGDWTVYADSQGINYKPLFESMDKDGMLHPIMVRVMNGKYRKWQAGGRRIIWAKKQGYTHISAYVLDKQEQVDEIYKITYNEEYK